MTLKRGLNKNQPLLSARNVLLEVYDLANNVTIAFSAMSPLCPNVAFGKIVDPQRWMMTHPMLMDVADPLRRTIH